MAQQHNLTDLTEGKILSTLITLAIPIMLTNFIQVGYGMVDMIWLGRLGSNAVAVIGMVTGYMIFIFAISTLISTGSMVHLSHAIGAKDQDKIRACVDNSIILTLLVAIILAILMILLRDKLIAFYGLKNTYVNHTAENYLVVSAIGVIFLYSNLLFSMIFNAHGMSKIPFRINSTGFIVNIILDPFLIFHIIPGIGMGVIGSAIATLIARIVVLTIFITLCVVKKDTYNYFRIKAKLHIDYCQKIFTTGFPVFIQRVAFAVISLYMARLVADYGTVALAVQRIGLQIESVSIMTAFGLQSALSIFVGQNFGAKKYHNIVEGYKIGFLIIGHISKN